MGFLLKELDGDLGKDIAEKRSQAPMVLIDYDKKGFQIWLEGDGIFIRDLDIFVYEGLSFAYDDETNLYEPNCDVIIFYDVKTSKEVYYCYEDSLYACLYNYCNQIGQPKTEEEILNFKCEYFPNGGQYLRDIILGGRDLEKELDNESV